MDVLYLVADNNRDPEYGSLGVFTERAKAKEMAQLLWNTSEDFDPRYPEPQYSSYLVVEVPCNPSPEFLSTGKHIHGGTVTYTGTLAELDTYDRMAILDSDWRINGAGNLVGYVWAYNKRDAARQFQRVRQVLLDRGIWTPQSRNLVVGQYLHP